MRIQKQPSLLCIAVNLPNSFFSFLWCNVTRVCLNEIHPNTDP